MNSHSRNNRTTPTVELKAVTWNKDSHGLFDYENNQYEMKKFQINHPAKIYRINNDIIPTTKEEVPVSESHKTEFLLSISNDAQNREKFFINSNQIQPPPLPSTQTPQNIYLIVRSLKANDGKNQRGYTLTPGDVIKLGRIEYRVIETQVGTNNLSVKKVAESYKDESFFDANKQPLPEGKDVCCRYCLSEDCAPKGTVDNVMLYPCKCTGASNGVHF